MGKIRTVHKLLSVFDIMNFDSILLPARSSIRVLFEYDADANIENYTILSNNIPEETCKIFVTMLKKNVPSEKIIYGLDSNNLDYRYMINRSILMSDIKLDQEIINSRESIAIRPQPENRITIN